VVLPRENGELLRSGEREDTEAPEELGTVPLSAPPPVSGSELSSSVSISGFAFSTRTSPQIREVRCLDA
jgi:hypothetical protein